MPHKDQKAVRDRVLGLMLGRALAKDDPVAERDCTVMVRLLIQGPDPLFLMEACPEEFRICCQAVGLSVDQGRDGIERAHWHGPGVLLEGTGINVGGEVPNLKDLSLANRQELLWLILADLSVCTEEGYTDKFSLGDRLRVAAKVISTLTLFAQTVQDSSFKGLYRSIVIHLEKWQSETEFRTDLPGMEGIPFAVEDHGFYLGYKSGHSVVAVRAGNNLFIGTVPSTSLEAQGIAVDKEISPQFGIRFDFFQETPS